MEYKAFGEEMSILAWNLPPEPFKSLKWPFCPYLAMGGHWEKQHLKNITICIQLFSIYMISYLPRHLPDALWHHPDNFHIPLDTILTPPDISILNASDGMGRKGYTWVSWPNIFVTHPHTPARHSKISPRYHPDKSHLYISESGNENWPESRVKEVVFAHRFWAFYNA